MKGLCVLAALVLIAIPSHAQVELRTQQVLPSEVTVRFEGGLATANYAKVLTTLGEANLINLLVYIDTVGVTPAIALKNLGYLAGSQVSPELDRYLCRANAHVCDVDGKTLATNWRNGKPLEKGPELDAWMARKGQPCGQVSSKSALPRYVLCMPEALTKPYSSFAEIKYTAGKDESLSKIVTQRTFGCVKFDAECRKLIMEFNPGTKPFSSSFFGTLTLPVRAYRVTFPVHSPDQFARLTTALDKTIGELTRSGQQTAETPRVYYTVPFEAKKQGGAVRLASLPPDPDSRQTLKEMNYPYLTDADFKSVAFEKVIVGVWDSAVDERHCDYVDSSGATAFLAVDAIPFRAEVDPRIPTKAGSCGTDRQPLTERWDHGTFTTGVIGARMNGRGVIGGHPLAQLWAWEITAERLRDDPIPSFSRRYGKPQVINLSITDDLQHQTPTDLDAIIRRYARAILFVASAGNAMDRNGRPVADPDPINAGDACQIFPACLSQVPATAGNVISVVALDQNGDRLKGAHPTQYGTAFDVAASGMATSTLYGDWIGTMDGTSVAAPFVTALAALIKSKALDQTPTPAQLKERILATVDFSSDFDVLVRFGRINYKRALDFDTDVLQPQQQFVNNAFNQRRRIKKSPSETLTVQTGVLDDQNWTPQNLAVSSIRRIQFDSATQTFWVAFVDGTGALKKARSVKFAQNATLKFGDANSPREFNVSQVLDYTCALDCK
jgi:subtilisin family serine protease